MTETRVRCHSPLTDGIEAFLTHKRSLGRRYDTEEKVLRLFDRYLVEQRINALEQINPEVLDAFLASRSHRAPRSYNHLLGCVRRFLDWLVLHEHIAASPLEAWPRRSVGARRPFLFDKLQARRLLDTAARLPDTPNARSRGPTYQIVFALLYGLGLRVSEAVRLRRQDLNFEKRLLVIRKTKFGKSRLVPFGPRLGERLQHYINARELRFGFLHHDHAIFSFAKDPRQAIYPTTVSWTFRKLVLELDFKVPAGVAPPHLHCLRHSFAVGVLLRWYRTGIDPSDRMLHLSTLLGHVSPASTAVYLTITNELLRTASERFEQFAAPSLGEVKL